MAEVALARAHRQLAKAKLEDRAQLREDIRATSRGRMTFAEEERRARRREARIARLRTTVQRLELQLLVGADAKG